MPDLDCKDYIFVLESIEQTLVELLEQPAYFTRRRSKYAFITRGGMDEVNRLLFGINFLQKVANLLVMIGVSESPSARCST